MAQTELEQIAMAMMMMAEDPERRRQQLQPMSTTAAVLETPNIATGSSISSTEDNVQKEEVEEDEEDEEMEKNGDTEALYNHHQAVGNNNYSINPNSLSTPPPSSPAGSLKSNGSSSTETGGGGGGANSATRRIFTAEFKLRVLDAFTNDPDCIGNQRATARKFNIHRRQVQKWLQQTTTGQSLDSNKDQPSSDEQEQKVKKTDKEPDFTTNPPSTSISLPSRNILAGKSNSKTRSNQSRAKMPIVAGKGPLISQASTVSSTPSASLPSSSPLMALGKGLGNIHHPLYSSGSFMGLASPLLSLPSLEASHTINSPPIQSPPNRGRHINGDSPTPANGNLSLTAQKMLELVDELCYLYPSEDFSLLRTAMLKNEVSFTKLSPPLRRHNSNSRKNPSSPPANDYITQQTLQMIKNQNEYLQLLQSGYANLSRFQDVANLSDHSNGKYASWLNPFAAAAAGYNTHKGTNKYGNGIDANRRRGNNSGNNDSSSYHNFASPKAPVSNPKSKTVAAVLAATRNGPTSHHISNSLLNDKTKRPSQSRRKMTNGGRSMKSLPSPPNNDDDYLDPTSMLEVVTSRPSPIENMDSYGMDLSTRSSSVIQRSPSSNTTSSTIRSKAMNKDYGFLSELGLVRKDERENNGHTSPPVSSLEHFVDSVISLRRSSPQTSSSGSPAYDSNHSTNQHESSDRSKESVLEAFTYDPELAGDARAVARKFGLNIRVVQKWIRETPTRSIPFRSNGHGQNGDDVEFEGTNENILQQRSVIASTSSAHAIGPTVNKRKNAKPNQICDFTEDDLDENGALDMVVPIKKRRVSTPTPTSA